MKQTQNTRMLSGERRGSGILSGERSSGSSVLSGTYTRGKATAVSRAGRENSETVVKHSTEATTHPPLSADPAHPPLSADPAHPQLSAHPPLSKTVTSNDEELLSSLLQQTDTNSESEWSTQEVEDGGAKCVNKDCQLIVIRWNVSQIACLTMKCQIVIRWIVS